MTTLLHVLDAGASETELGALALLLDRLATADFPQYIAAIDGPTAVRAEQRLNRSIIPAYRRLGVAWTCGPRLREVLHDERVDLVHAWGVDALAAVKSASRDLPVVAAGLHPDRAADAAQWIRALPNDPAVVTSSQVARGRLVQHGVRPGRIAVIRGAVDFAAINNARRDDVRRRIVGDASPVILTVGPATRGDALFKTVWAACIVQQAIPHIRMLMPYASPEAAKARRVAEAAHLPSMIIVPPETVRWAELVASADVLLLATEGEAMTEPIAWAMAAGLGIVAPARRSIAELLADRHNGLLCKENRPRPLAGALLRMLEDEQLRRKLADTARGQAYEVFSVRAFVDNHAKLYRNLIAGREVAADVSDTAMVA